MSIFRLGEYRNEVLEGEVLEVLKRIPDNSIDAIPTDPPYGLGNREPTLEEIIAYLNDEAELDQGGDFMGKDWNIPRVAVWKECYRVLKPGGLVVAFAGTRTFDLVSMGLRAAGFEYRDTLGLNEGPRVLQWVYGEGMPKSYNIPREIDKKLGIKSKILVSPDAKQWEGYGTALKPAFEPIVVFRKPLEGTILKNLAKHGTGGLNIDGCRIPRNVEEFYSSTGKLRSGMGHAHGYGMGDGYGGENANPPHPNGAWPANLLLSHTPLCREEECHHLCPVRIIGEQGGETVSASTYERKADGLNKSAFGEGLEDPAGTVTSNYEARDTVARYFTQFQGELKAPFLYCPKPSEKEYTLNGRVPNNHPTRKPLKLMRWLVRLITTKGSHILDPYCGSGTTLHAAILEGCHFTGIDRDPEFVKIARQRVEIVLDEVDTMNGYHEAYNMMFEDD